ncbi:unnamed protein product, partial [marine sediment metagenome]
VYEMSNSKVYAIRSQKRTIRLRQNEEQFLGKEILYHKYSPNSKYHFNRVKQLLREMSDEIVFNNCCIDFGDHYTIPEFIHLLHQVEEEKNNPLTDTTRIESVFIETNSIDLERVEIAKETILEDVNESDQAQTNVPNEILNMLKNIEVPLPPYNETKLSSMNITKLKKICSIFWNSNLGEYKSIFTGFSKHRRGNLEEVKNLLIENIN